MTEERDVMMGRIRLLVLRLTERCNLRCAYCYAARDREPAFDMEEATALQAAALCCAPGESLRIQFTGGEPLLRLELMEAVAEYGRETGRKLSLSVQTNGTLLTPEVCRRLKAIRCGVGVSLDGVGASNALRVFPDGRASWERTVEGIRSLGKCGMRCGLTAVVTSANAEELGHLADLALVLGNVAGVGLDLFRPMGRGRGRDFSPSPQALTRGVRNLRRQAERLNAAGIPFRFREKERLEKRRAAKDCRGIYCYAQTNASLAVDGQGNFWPCSSLAGQEEFLLGNIRHGLPEENRGADRLDAPPGCKRCASFALCLGGCPARRYGLEEGDRLNCMLQHALSDEDKGERNEAYTVSDRNGGPAVEYAPGTARTE